MTTVACLESWKKSSKFIVRVCTARKFAFYSESIEEFLAVTKLDFVDQRIRSIMWSCGNCIICEVNQTELGNFWL